MNGYRTTFEDADRRQPATSRSLDDVLAEFRRWLHFPDPQPLYLNLAAELANRMEEGDPVWLMNLGGSSRGKTELLGAFTGLPNVRVVGSLTEAALLSGTPKKERATNAAGGLLKELPTYGATIVVKDFGAILTLPRDRRAQVVQALRDIYDGYYVRDVGTSGGLHLEWRGRIGLLAGATGSLDSHHGVIAALGERWLTLRLPTDGRTGRRTNEEAMARRALAGSQTKEMRALLADTLGGYATTLAPPAMGDLDDVDADLLVALAVLVTAARSPVERDPRTRELENVPQGEGPARFTRQLHKLTLCLGELGLDRDQTHACLRRLALDSIPPARRQALELLLTADQPQLTPRVAVALRLPTGTTRRVLEDLTAVDLLHRAKTKAHDNAQDEWWPTEPTRELWRCVANPYGQAKTGVPEMSQPHLLRERQNVEEDFSGTRTELAGGVDGAEVERLAELSRQAQQEELF